MIMGAYVILADDLGPQPWFITNPYMPDYLDTIRINTYYLGFMAPSFCYPNACGQLLGCCGTDTTQNRINYPPEAFIQATQNRGSGPGQIPEDAFVFWTLVFQTKYHYMSICLY